MEGLYLGIDLGDRWCQAGWFDPQTKDTGSVDFYDNNNKIETILCKKIGEDYWCIGREALDCSRTGKGILVEHLKLMEMRSMSLTVDGEQYQASQLMEIFMGKLIRMILDKTGREEVAQVAIAMRESSAVFADHLVAGCARLGIGRSRVHVLNYCEAFLFYVLSRRPEVRKSLCSLFELSGQELYYYEFRTIRGRSPVHVGVISERQEMTGADSPEESAAGTDAELLEAANRLMDKKLISSVFLTGESFERGVDWAPGFVRQVCHGRKVFASPNLFAQGAAAAAWGGESPEHFPCVCLCDGRLGSTLSMEVTRGDNQYQLILASMGDNWYEARTTAEFVLEDTDQITLNVDTFGERLRKKLVIGLDGFGETTGRTLRVRMTTAFLGDDRLMVKLKDLGFGDIFPSSGIEIKKYYALSELE